MRVVLDTPDQDIDPGSRIVRVPRELDVDTAVAMEDVVTRLLDGQCTPAVVLLDLSELRFVDVAGLGALARCARRSRVRGGGLMLLAPAPGVARVLDLVGLASLATVVDGPVVLAPAWSEASRRQDRPGRTHRASRRRDPARPGAAVVDLRSDEPHGWRCACGESPEAFWLWCPHCGASRPTAHGSTEAAW